MGPVEPQTRLELGQRSAEMGDPSDAPAKSSSTKASTQNALDPDG
jgi:hypothetical protein